MLNLSRPGVRSMLYAGFLFGIAHTLVKMVRHIPAVEIVFFRSVITLVISFVMLRFYRVSFHNLPIGWLFLRGLLGTIGLCLFFYAIHIMPLAAAVSVLYLAPVFTLIWGIFLTREIPPKALWPYLFLSFAGTALMKYSEFKLTTLDIIIALSAAFFAGGAYAVIRRLSGKVNHHMIILFFPLATLPLVSPYLYFHWVPPIGNDWYYLGAIGIFTQLAQVYLTKAYLLESPANIVHLNYLTSIYAIFSGLYFFDEKIDMLSIIGMVVMLAGVYKCSQLSKAS